MDSNFSTLFKKRFDKAGVGSSLTVRNVKTRAEAWRAERAKEGWKTSGDGSKISAKDAEAVFLLHRGADWNIEMRFI